MSVFRITELPQRPNRGRLIDPEQEADQTKVALLGFRGPDGRHEGLVYWLGRRVGADTLILAGYLPQCDHGPQHVLANDSDIGEAVRTARSVGLCVVAQVHSHPGCDTRHSDGDDRLILMPFNGMFSLVVGDYGRGGMTLDQGIGLHQFQDGRWVQVPAECREALCVVPTVMGGLL